MKRLTHILAVFCILLILVINSNACTSFVIYSNTNLYGMNFDYNNNPDMRIYTNNVSDKIVYSLMFNERGSYLPVVRMNDKGFFVNSQMQYPMQRGKTSRDNNEFYIPQLLDLVNNYSSIDELSDYLSTSKFVHWSNMTLHSMLADTNKNAIIIEAGNNKNTVIEKKEDFLVMSNFRQGKYIDKSYKFVSGFGADRYKTMYKYIDENQDSFSIYKGFMALKKTVQSNVSKTQCSMIFDPGKYVFIAFKGDFNKIWKISLKEKTIETLIGFSEKVKIEIPIEGLSVNDLLSESYEKYSHTKSQPSETELSKELSMINANSNINIFESIKNAKLNIGISITSVLLVSYIYFYKKKNK